MDLLYLLVGLVVLFHLLAVVMILRGDADILLQIKTKFGKSVKSLAGQVVWITGASSGIGEELAYELARAGCRLVLSARRTKELERVKKECMLRGSVKDEDILILTLDCIDFDSHKSAVDKVLAHFKKIDVLVNNAGRSQRAEWVKTGLQVDRDVLELNVLGVLSLTKLVLPHMADRRSGHIVNVSSIAGKLGAPLSGSYTGAKHAIQGWFDSLRVEMFDKNVSVTNICPGPVFSNILAVAFTENAGEELKSQMNPKETRMKTDRCAYLMGVAIANNMWEVWITNNPVLLFTYANQYMPNVTKWLSCRMGLKTIQKIREGQN
ncbi:dehydrogenase/reductase SDR family member 7-like [Mizuhopecten yessoensis]|uniref:Dehydrogenase/reductase SDR family member 7 n=1 Tax=Mizuhopecten yessoensis TaxID=6573 RepID=A0A210PMA7_MIZYE|nr:dehydrogenase/reductase SDR family member 7-like [Mizuhopecten yessoensis]XP_021379945.1 dehydrogenase/reductase SDR family member 7-like [Mizuhopecten yessoensis]XP_021379946.1 dehydrogenase/reductase SDR family member 7-like [Mizuhopecten yessoensis]OWF37619.1 Dehydrogenase/reductase SDR family member 7 [Mizuhopecten yessoensis]